MCCSVSAGAGNYGNYPTIQICARLYVVGDIFYELRLNNRTQLECTTIWLMLQWPHLFQLFIVPPSAILVLDEKDNPIQNSTTLGPLREGNQFTSKCEVRGARPAPSVGWYMAGKRLTGGWRVVLCHSYDYILYCRLITVIKLYYR